MSILKIKVVFSSRNFDRNYICKKLDFNGVDIEREFDRMKCDIINYQNNLLYSDEWTKVISAWVWIEHGRTNCSKGDIIEIAGRAKQFAIDIAYGGADYDNDNLFNFRRYKE